MSQKFLLGRVPPGREAWNMRLLRKFGDISHVALKVTLCFEAVKWVYNYNVYSEYCTQDGRQVIVEESCVSLEQTKQASSRPEEMFFSDHRFYKS